MTKHLTIVVLVLSVFILALSLRGNAGSPKASELNSSYWKESGPFELSPERGRFALTYSLIEDQSFQFSKEIGKFASPDVAIQNGHFVSLFAPGVSIITALGYLVGKVFNLTQVGVFATIAFFALLNTILIRQIAQHLGAGKITSTISSVIFLFATPAFAYAVNLYQHHISTFMILFSLYALLKFKIVIALAVCFFIFALSISIDYPNIFFFIPTVVYALGKFFGLKKHKNTLSVKVHIFRLFTPFVMILPIFLFLIINQMSYSSPFQLSGTLKTAKSPSMSSQLTQNDYDISKLVIAPEKVNTDSTNAVSFFKTRNLINGLYIHLLSPDRGVVFYSPVLLIGVLGAVAAYKRKIALYSILVSTISVILILYSMWGDPWGGWAFGSRYLIPAYAILAIFASFGLEYIKRFTLIILLAFILLTYSLFVNTLGALTSSANPPQVETENLEKQSGLKQEYTFKRNLIFLTENGSKSYVYNTYFKDHLNAPTYFGLILTLLISMNFFLFFKVFFSESTFFITKRLNKKIVLKVMKSFQFLQANK